MGQLRSSLHYAVLSLSSSLLLCGMTSCSSSTESQGDVSQEAQADVSDLSSADIVPVPEDLAETQDSDQSDGEDCCAINPTSAAGLESSLQDYLGFTGEPGVSAALLWGATFWEGAAGVSDVTTKDALTTAAQMRVGSNSKPYLAVVVMQLVEEGLIDLDAPMITYLPQYSQWPDVTVRHLLGMRSGLPEYVRSMTMWADVLEDFTAKIPPERLIEYIADEPVAFQPGEGCSYCNTNYVLLGLIVKAVTGNEPADELYNRVIKPLGLKNTYMDRGDSAPTAHGYFDSTLGAYHFQVDPMLMSLFPKEYQVGSEGWFDVTTLITATMAYTAGSIISTPEDGVRFIRALMTGELLQPQSLEAMMQFGPCDILGEPVEYGLGLMRWHTKYGTAYGHGGRIYGYHANLCYVPDSDMAVCRLHNFLPAEGTPLTEELMRWAFEEPRFLSICKAPDGFFSGDEPRLELRFRGVNGAVSYGNDVEAPDRPMVRVVEHASGKKVLRFGAGSASPMDSAQPERIQVETFGPGANSKKLRRVYLSLDASALPAADPDGTLSLGQQSANAVTLLLQDVDLDDAGEPVKRCTTAVWNPSAPSSLLACDPISPAPLAGAPLRFYASLALTSDAAALDRTGPKCECLSEGVWGSCP